MLQSIGKMLKAHKTGQLCQVPIRTSRKLDLHSKKVIASLKERPKANENLNTVAKIGIVKLRKLGEEGFAVVVCHNNGKFEYVPLQNKAGPSSTANT